MVASWSSRTLAVPRRKSVKWLADENLRNAIIRGLLRKAPTFDIVRVQDIPEISGEDDSLLLRYATAKDRVVVTHDLSTMIPAMRLQIRFEQRCAPIVMAPDSLAVGVVVDDLLMLDRCATEADWTAGVIYLPLR